MDRFITPSHAFSSINEEKQAFRKKGCHVHAGTTRVGTVKNSRKKRIDMAVVAVRFRQGVVGCVDDEPVLCPCKA